MYAEKARQRATQIVDEQPGLWQQIGDPSLRNRMIDTIAEAIIDAYFEGRREQHQS